MKPFLSTDRRHLAGGALLRFGWAGVVGILLLIGRFCPLSFLPWGLMLGSLLVAPLFAGIHNIVLAHAAGHPVGWRQLLCVSSRGWIVLGAMFPCIIFLFLAGVYYLTIAFPLSGSLTYLFVTLGADFLVAGWLDLLTGRLLMGVLMLLLCLGWVYAPALVVVEGAGLRAALSRSWRMVCGHRLWLFSVCVRALWFPVSLTLAAAVSGILQFGHPLVGPTAQGLRVVAMLVLVLWSGPRVVTALLCAYPQLLPVDKAEIRHVVRIRRSPFSRQRDTGS